MKLHPIDKPTYKQRYKTVVFGLIAGLAVLSLSFSTILISLYGDTEAGSNTLLNAFGVALAATLLAIIAHSVKRKPYFAEVVYVWTLKQELMQINRRINNIKAAAAQGDHNAMTVLNYCYTGSEQVWQLEDNTLVMDELHTWMSDLEQLRQKFNVELSLEDYHRELLRAF